MEGPNPMASTGPHLSTTAAGAESPMSDSSGAATTPKPPPRVWGLVAATTEKNLAEFPTAAEASKMAAHDSAQADSSSGHHQGTNGISKSIDDENEDFLFAEKIEFADGAVNVKEVVNLVARSEESKTPQQQDTTAQIAPRREERVVERSDDDFDRQWPHRSGPGTFGADSTSRYSHGTGDRSRQQLWQGSAPTSARDPERRPSMDRDRRPSTDHHGPFFGPPSSGRRESFGQRDSFRGNGPSRRDSATGRLDSLGPPSRDYGDRRDSFDHHRDRDYDYGRGRAFSRDREYGRGGDDFSQDRRGSYDRRSQDRSSQRYDHHIGSRPRDPLSERSRDRSHDFIHHDGPGTSGGRGPYHDQGTSYGRQHPYAQVPPPPPGVVEFDRPSHVSEEQRETMKHAAEEARKRREEEERQREEARARAKAKADALAQAMDKKKQEKEEAEHAKQEEEKARAAAIEKEKQAAQDSERAKAKVSAAASPTAVADRGKGRNGKPRVTSGAEQVGDVDAIAEWNALPAKLVQEGKERAEQVRAERRREEEERRGASAAPNAWTSGQSNLTTSWRRADTGASDVATSSLPSSTPVTNGSTLKPEPAIRPPASNETKEPTVGQIDSVMKNIKEHFDSRGTSLEKMEASIRKEAQRQEAAATSVPTDISAEAASTPVTTARDGKAMSPETDSLAEKGLSARERQKLRGPRGGAERAPAAAAPATTLPQSRADHAQTWRRETPLVEAKPVVTAVPTETKDAQQVSTGDGTATSIEEPVKTSVDDVPRPEPAVTPVVSGKGGDDSAPTETKSKEPNRVRAEKAVTAPNGAVRPVKRREPLDYPARTVDPNQHATIGDITTLFARISNLPAGESPAYDPLALKAATPQTTDIPTAAAASKTQVPGDAAATTTAAADKTAKDHHLKSGHATKRHSLSSMSAPIVFPSNVEQAINRGRMSFMVASEIEGEAVADKSIVESKSEVTVEKAPSDTTTQQASDAQQGVANGGNLTKPVTSVPSVLPSSVAIHPGIYGIQPGASAGAAALPQYPWSGVDSSQPGSLSGSTGMMMPPTGSTGHTMQPYQHVMQPFYTYVHPYFFQYGHRGPMHPSLAQYSAAAMVSGGQQNRMMVDGATAAALATAASQHGGFSSAPGVSNSSSITVSSATVTSNLGTTSIKNSAAGTTTAAAAGATGQANETHPWLPRFSAAGDAPTATTATTHVPIVVPGSNIIAASQRGGLSTRPMTAHAYQQVVQEALAGSSSNSPVTPTGSGFQSLSEEDGWTSSTGFSVHSAPAAAQHGWGLPTGTAGRMAVGTATTSGNSASGGLAASGGGGGVASSLTMTQGFVMSGQDAFHSSQVQAHPSMHGRSRGGGYGGHYGRGGYGSQHHHHHHHQQQHHTQHHHQHQDGHIHHGQQQHAVGGSLMSPMAGVGSGSASDRSQRPFGSATATTHHHHGQTHFHGHHGPQGAPSAPHNRRVNSGAGGGGAQAGGGNSATGGAASEAGASFAQFSARSTVGTAPTASGNSSTSF
ncbi:hypothetical protein BGZ73_006126 [Actinomortierella ambigua]|nr:hypothetical protein BGZ73_006126 [Actinomortierella ambigua]